MRIFVASVLVAVIVAAGAYSVAHSIQESTENAYTTGSSRMDWPEEHWSVSGREVTAPLLAE